MPNDFGRAARNVKRLSDNIEQSVNTQLGAAFGAMNASVRAALIVRDSVVTSTLHDSIEYKRGTDADVLDKNVGRTDSYGKHVIRADAPYAPYVEYGTGVHQKSSPRSGIRFPAPSEPPYGAILEWVIAKPIIPQEYNSQFGVAKAIAEAIATEGQEPHPYMRPAWIQHRQDMSIAHRKGVQTALRRSFNL